MATTTFRQLGAFGVPDPRFGPSFSAPGQDVVVLRMTQDYYLEDARFAVAIDGVPVGDAYSLVARRNFGDLDDFVFTGVLGAGPHTVTVRFLNDLYGGTPETDRNLIVDHVYVNGTAVPGQGATHYGLGPVDYALPATATVPVAPDTLLLRLSQDYYLENARFVVRVDGVQQGGINTITVRRGEVQDFTFAGDFGDGAHRVSIDFLNDHFDAATGADSNLIVEQVRFNGAVVPDAPAIQYGPGPREFAVPDTAPPPPSTGPDVLVLALTQDYYVENAQFVVSVDGVRQGGVNTVQLRRDQFPDRPQEFTFRGDFGDGAHRVSIDFLNDNFDPGVGDSNLIVVSAALNGVAASDAPAIQYAAGPREFTTPAGADPAGGPLAPVLLSDIAAGVGGFKISFAPGSGLTSSPIAGAGDVNGDGYDDVVLGDFNYSALFQFSGEGAAYVVFGGPSGGGVSLADVAANPALGVRFTGQAFGDAAGTSVSGAGDVNGDGIADLLVGAPGANTANGIRTGAGYVVFGRSDGAVPSLTGVAAGTGGFEIIGRDAAHAVGRAVAAAGDVNGDGRDDVILGGSTFNPGALAVVFGKAGGGAVNLGALPGSGAGFELVRERPQLGSRDADGFGNAVAGAGDVNGDGLDDVVVGVFGDDTGGPNRGTAYVVFGKTDGATVQLAGLGTAGGPAGFKIRGDIDLGSLGRSVAGAGDVNGDGLDDVIAFGSTNGTTDGRAYVVFGKADGATVNVADLATDAATAGFRIEGRSLTGPVSAAGDLDGDGLADLLVGASTVSVQGTVSVVGRAPVVVFGKADGAGVNIDGILAGTAPGGFAILGEGPGRVTGSSVSAAGDVNGDGYADLLVGASVELPEVGNVGAGYVIYGRADWHV